LETPLLGSHQAENATLALAVLELLRERGYRWDEGALRHGFRAVHWPARVQIVGQDPTIVVDGAHNTDSVQKLLQTLDTTFDHHRRLVVLGINTDKDLAGIVRLLADVDAVVLTRAKSPRSASTETLAELFAQYAPSVDVHHAPTTAEAMDLACDLADASDLICATGSLYLAAEALRWAADHGDQQAASEIEGVDH
jgi:dihydrofolate synthase/folylpolyglutamate synthase